MATARGVACGQEGRGYAEEAEPGLSGHGEAVGRGGACLRLWAGLRRKGRSGAGPRMAAGRGLSVGGAKEQGRGEACPGMAKPWEGAGPAACRRAGRSEACPRIAKVRGGFCGVGGARAQGAGRSLSGHGEAVGRGVACCGAWRGCRGRGQASPGMAKPWRGAGSGLWAGLWIRRRGLSANGNVVWGVACLWAGLGFGAGPMWEWRAARRGGPIVSDMWAWPCGRGLVGGALGQLGGRPGP